MSTLKLLVVEDSWEYRQVYERLLQNQRLAGRVDPRIVETAESAIRTLRTTPPDLVILDWSLPGKSGMAVLDAIRADPRTRGASVIVVTSLSGKAREVEALDFGADDYLSKPFDAEVLIARLLNLARRQAPVPEAAELSELGELRLELPSGRLSIGSKTVELFNKEARLLRVFIRRPDVIHPLLSLWDEVWGYESASFRNTLQVTLSNLRKKLGPKCGGRLENVKDQGYLFRSR